MWITLPAPTKKEQVKRVFHGPNNVTLDAKGRIALPARLRAPLETLCVGQFVVTRDLSLPCLLLFPLPHWQALAEELGKLSNTNATHQRVKRLLLGNAVDLELDGTGRLLLPPELRGHLELNKDITLVGYGRHFQIWDQARWNEQMRVDTEANVLGADDLPPLSF